MTICETRIDKIISSPEAKLTVAVGLHQIFEIPEGLIEVERIVRDGVVRQVERRLYGQDGELLEVDTVSLLSGKVRTEDATSYEHRKSREDAAEAKKEISKKVRAWAKENADKQARLDRLGHTITRLEEQIVRREQELKAARVEFSGIMAEKRDFLSEE